MTTTWSDAQQMSLIQATAGMYYSFTNITLRLSFKVFDKLDSLPATQSVCCVTMDNGADLRGVFTHSPVPDPFHWNV